MATAGSAAAFQPDCFTTNKRAKGCAGVSCTWFSVVKDFIESNCLTVVATMQPAQQACLRSKQLFFRMVYPDPQALHSPPKMQVETNSLAGLHQSRSDPLHRLALGLEERVDHELDKALGKDGAVVRHNVRIDFHQPVG